MDSKVNCICGILDEIDEFYSILEFQRFQKYIADLVKNGDLKEVNVKKGYFGLPEQWFICTTCKKTWRLVHPDFPFKGLWEVVK